MNFSLSRRLCRGLLPAIVCCGLFTSTAFAETCSYTVTHEWPGGFIAEVRIKNTGTLAVSGWNVSLNYPDNSEITNVWNGNLVDTQPYQISNVSWNEIIPANDQVTFSLQGTTTSSKAQVASVTDDLCAVQSAANPTPEVEPKPELPEQPEPEQPIPQQPETEIDPILLTGQATHFEKFGEPYGGCGVPEQMLDTPYFVALNVYDSPEIYDVFWPRPLREEDQQYLGEFENGRNCGRWVEVTIGENCSGFNDGVAGEGFCRNGQWYNDKYSGATLNMLIADSCGDNNGWCRDSKYHLDLATHALNKFELDGQPVADMYPLNWSNRKVHWRYIEAPNYSGDIKIHFMQNASVWWPAISITNLRNGIHGVEQLHNGEWLPAQRNSDMGQSFILPAANAHPFQIRVLDADDQFINNGRIYSFEMPAECAGNCSKPATTVNYDVID